MKDNTKDSRERMDEDTEWDTKEQRRLIEN
jgi:hypothetical protein